MSSNQYLKELLKKLGLIWVSLRTTLLYMIGASHLHKVVTEEYPDKLSARMPEDLPQRFRGLLYNDISRCSGCRFCADTCPVECIHIETESGPLPNVSWIAVFDIDHAKCMYCGLCVEVCPTKSLVHTRKYEGAETDLTQLVYSFGKGYATSEMRQRWKKEQTAREQMAEEIAQLEKNPVGAELIRRVRAGEDQ